MTADWTYVFNKYSNTLFGRKAETRPYCTAMLRPRDTTDTAPWCRPLLHIVHLAHPWLTAKHDRLNHVDHTASKQDICPHLDMDLDLYNSRSTAKQNSYKWMHEIPSVFYTRRSHPYHATSITNLDPALPRIGLPRVLQACLVFASHM